MCSTGAVMAARTSGPGAGQRAAVEVGRIDSAVENGPDGRDAASRRPGRFRRVCIFRPGLCQAIFVFGALVLGLVCGALVWTISYERAQSAAHAVKQNEALARAFEEHVASTIGGVDHLAQLVRLQHSQWGAALDLPRLLAQVSVPASVVQVAIISVDGAVTHSSLRGQRDDVSGREHFRVHRDGDAPGLFISEPVVGRVAGRWSLQLSRRIDRPGGGFAGVVVISIDPLYFADFYRRVDGSRFIALVGRDGIVRAAEPTGTLAPGADMRRSPLFQRLALHPHGTYLERGALDGVVRYTSYRTMSEHELVVVVGEPEGEAMAAFHARRRYLIAAALAVTLLVLGTAAWLTALARRDARNTRQLQNSRASLRAFMDSVPDLGWMKDAGGRFQAVNRAFAERVGVEPARLVGQTDNRVFGDELAARFRADDARVMATGQMMRAESTVERAGETRWMETIKVPAYDAAGAVCGTCGISRDITERKRAELELKESERRLQLALEGAEVALFDWDVATGEVFISERWAVLLGNSAAPTYTTIHALSALVHPDDRRALDRQVMAALRQDALYRVEHRVRRPDGEWMWVESHGAVVVRDAAGRALRMMGINREITGRKRMEDALRASEHRFRNLTELSSDWYWEQDEECRYTRISPGFEKHAGLSVEEFIGRRCWELPSRRDSPESVAAHQSLLARREAFHDWETQHIDRDGRLRHWCISGRPMFDASGRYVGYLGVGRDVSEQKRSQAQMEALNRMLEQRASELAETNRALDAYSYTVSHDLHGPLRHISGFSRLLRERVADRSDAHAERLFDHIDRATQRMGCLIDDLLAFSRTTRVELRAAAVPLGDLVRDIIEDASPAAAGRKIEWRVGTLPTVHADPTLIRVALSNLVDNALKYTGKRAEAIVEIGAQRASESAAVICVRDNGVGFDMKDADRLFGVFERLHDGRDYEGNGIGLATVKRIVERHGGRVWAEGERGVGAAFYVALPLTARIPAPLPDPPSRGSP